MIEIGLLLVIAVAVFAARGGMTTGLLSAAFAAVALIASALLLGVNVTVAHAMTSAAFTICFVVVGYVVGRLRDRLEQVRGVHQIVHAEVVDADERLSSVLESVTDGFVTLDENWRLTYVNHRAERILGRSRQHLIGRSALDVFPEGVGSRIHQELERARNEEHAIEFEAWYEPGQRWFEVRAYPSDHGGLTVYFRDVTRRKEAQGSLAVQARLLDAVGQAVIAAGTDGIIFYCNRAAEELFGPARELVNHANIAKLQLEDEPGIAALLDRARNTRGWSGTMTLRRPNGSSFPAHVSDSPIVDHDGSFIGMVRVAQDASSRQAEQQSQRLLADAGSALAATLNYEHTLATVVEFVVP
ncbi:MAG TPA: PAS domain S-box protein [Longimicrobiales bacterium]|nr:PAS domain S-box protein [Longimicrobiales bacterium]